MELARLRRELGDAVAREQYESAAQLRDDIRRLEAT
jgi:protein-arginine kinase activator protein McsA